MTPRPPTAPAAPMRAPTAGSWPSPLRDNDWRRLGLQDTTLSELDIARRLAERAHDPAPVVRALAEHQVLLRLDRDGRVTTSRFAGTIYVHVYSSRLRLEAARAAPREAPRDESVQQSRFAAISVSWPSDTGLRLDPGTEAQLTLDPPEVRQARALGAGVPVPAAFRPVAGERLLVTLGPAEVAPLDEQVCHVVRSTAPEAVLRRRAAYLDGVAGRSWPCYDIRTDGVDGPGLVESIERELRRPLAIVVDGRPQWLARRLDQADGPEGLLIPSDR